MTDEGEAPSQIGVVHGCDGLAAIRIAVIVPPAMSCRAAIVYDPHDDTED